MGRANHIWTPEEDARLHEMRSDGYTAKQMAVELGMTRCAVLGRTHRLKIPLPQNRIAKHREQRAARVNVSLTKRVLTEMPPIPADQCLPVLMENLDVGTCRYPVSDTFPLMFCNMPVQSGCYCNRHWYITHQQPGKTNTEIAA